MPRQRQRRLVLRPRFWLLTLIPAFIIFYTTYQSRTKRIDEQAQLLQSLNQQVYDASMEEVALQNQLSQVGTDPYIEQQARREYGYLKPGEIRFVVDNLLDPTLSPYEQALQNVQGLTGTEAQVYTPVEQAPANTEAWPLATPGASLPAATPETQAAPAAKDWSQLGG